MIEVALNEIEKMYGGNKILKGVTLQIPTGERVGLVGRNGSGKTTLLKIIAGIEKCDGGSMAIRKMASIGYLNQISDIQESFKVIDVLYMAFEEQFEIYKHIKKYEKQMEELAGNEAELEVILKKYGNAQQLYEQMDGFNIDEKICKVCSGLQISEAFLEREFHTLSGGEKTTIILGRILLQNPDILLLDEPTNHLDMGSMEWLEDFLAKYKGTVIVVSHDRYFLDRVVNRIIEVDNEVTETYTGNYSDYCMEKEKRILEQVKRYTQQQNKIKQLEKAANNLREWGRVADNPALHKRARNIEKRIENMENVEKPMLKESAIRLAFENTESWSREAIRVEGLTKAFGSKIILHNLDLHVLYREKIALLGKNGVGKSTLFKILRGEYLPDKGNVIIGPGTKAAYVEQNILFSRQDNTVLKEFCENVKVSEGEARKILARFLFKGEGVFKKVKNLSGGEKSRLRLCQIMQQEVNLLILDEPTNHLDINSMEMLEKALNEFEGTIIFISHDRYFINQIADRIIELKEGKLINYTGNYEYYKEKIQEKLNDFKPVQENRGKQKKLQSSDTTEKTQAKREKQDSKIENRIEQLELQIKEMTDEMDAYSTDFEKLDRLYRERSALEGELDRLMNKWLNAI